MGSSAARKIVQASIISQYGVGRKLQVMELVTAKAAYKACVSWKLKRRRWSCSNFVCSKLDAEQHSELYKIVQ